MVALTVVVGRWAAVDSVLIVLIVLIVLAGAAASVEAVAVVDRDGSGKVVHGLECLRAQAFQGPRPSMMARMSQAGSA